MYSTMMGSRYTGPSFSQPRRDRQHRGRNDIDGNNLGNYIQRLTIDPRNRQYIESRIFRNYDPRRPFSERRITELGRGSEQGYMDRRLGSMAQIRDAMPFGRAMRKLHDQVNIAEQFYSDFQSEYDNEISSLKKYAPNGVLTGLWKARIVGRRDSKTVLDGEDKDDDEELRELRGKFEDNAKDLRHALKVALAADFRLDATKSNQNKIRCGEANCLFERVVLSNTNIRQLLRVVTESREECVLLLKQLVELKRVVDPESEVNKFLFQSPMDEEDEDAAPDDAGAEFPY